MRARRFAPLLAWIAFALIAAAVLVTLVVELRTPPGLTVGELLGGLPWRLVPTWFALVGALIVSRRPGNAIGLLLFLPSLVLALPIELFLKEAPAAPTLGLMLLIWFRNVGWLLLIFPILFLLLLFPTGRVPGPRWRWLIPFGVLLVASFSLGAVFVVEYGPVDGDWAVTNPIGLYTLEQYDRTFIRGWLIALPLFTLLCAASLVVRYRRAVARERAQIRWLLYAGAIFAVVYALSFGILENGAIYQMVLGLSILAIPTAVALAILRHQLYDIDVIIRRTLQYGVLTGILIGLYAGSVLLFQTVLGPLVGGADSPPVVIVTTLLLAALFNPLRVRVQRFIDRRFFRSKVDAERALARFASLARDEVDLDQLRLALLGTVGETLHPVRMGLWLQAAPRRSLSEGES